MRSILTPFALVLFALALQAQNPVANTDQVDAKPDPAHRDWHASWITHPTAPLREPVVLHFRRTLALAAVPATYIDRKSVV